MHSKRKTRASGARLHRRVTVCSLVGPAMHVELAPLYPPLLEIDALGFVLGRRMEYGYLDDLGNVPLARRVGEANLPEVSHSSEHTAGDAQVFFLLTRRCVARQLPRVNLRDAQAGGWV